LRGNFRSLPLGSVPGSKSLTDTVLQYRETTQSGASTRAPCKTRPGLWRRGLLIAAVIGLFVVTGLAAQQTQAADQAWLEGRYDAARAAYLRALAQDPHNVRANLRLGVLLSWEGKLDSSLVLIGRARAGDPADPDIRIIQARVMAWAARYDEALLSYDSLLIQQPRLHEAQLGRARTLAWAGRLDQAAAAYRRMIAADSTDRDARLGAAQVSAWRGDLARAETEYRTLLKRNSRDVEARVGLGYVYLWQGRTAAAERQAGYALAMDSTNKAGRELRHAVRVATQASLEPAAYWSNDSDQNTSFWQTLAAHVPLGGTVGIYGSVNALETSDPVRDAFRVGGEAGLSLSSGGLQLFAAAGARHLMPEVAPDRTAATYRARVGYRPSSRVGLSAAYSRQPFDEIASLFELALDMESLDGGFDVKPTTTLTVFGAAGGLWLSDGNSRTSFAGGLNQKIGRHFYAGVFGRTLSYEQRGIGYFSPDRFSVLEGTAGYTQESRSWLVNLSGGLGAQQIGASGSAQTEWHLEGRVGPRWGSGNRLELFGMVTNSAVSSTTGAFRYRSAGLSMRLGL